MKKSFFLTLIFSIVFLELVIGGSGHFLEVGSLTIRMVFYLLLTPISVLYYLKKNTTNKSVNRVLVLYTVMIIMGLVVGMINNASINLILIDIKPLIFFYMLLFFFIATKDIKDIQRISKLIKIGAITMAIIHFYYVYSLFTGRINYLEFYAEHEESNEIFFRSEFIIFYKGFLYLSVGFFFFLTSKSRFRYLFMILLLLSIGLTLTRGFILFTLLISGYYILFVNKKIKPKLRMIVVGIAMFIYAIPILIESIGDKSASDSQRFIQIEQVVNNINPLSILFGHGFGIGVESKPIHMEIAFLEIFHKQGLFGIFIWLGIFIFIVRLFKDIKIKEYKYIAYPFLLSTVFAILQSFTNPYVNNPIGMSMILITIVVFLKLIELQKKEQIHKTKMFF